MPDIIYICFEEIVELNANNVLISSNQDIVDLYTKKITSEIIDQFIKNYDKDKSGTLDFEEFKEFAVKTLKTYSQ